MAVLPARPYLPIGDAPPLDLIRDWKPDALIVREDTPHHYDDLLAMKVPIVYAPTTEPSHIVSNIVVDDHAVGRLAAHHLYESGLRHFGFCGINKAFFWSRKRCAGFCKAIAEYGYEVSDFERQADGNVLSWNGTFEVLKDWISSLPARTGVMVCTDDFSLLVQEACLAAGRAIPEEISLIGVSNDEAVCELASTPLSSIDLNTERAGYDAARLLAEQLISRREGRKTTRQDIIIDPMQVVARRSTDATVTADTHVSRAITFIREHINHSITVEDVVREVHLSRRALYDRFQAVTGKPISSYIRERRVEHFSKLLLETNLSIAEIAYSMG